VRASPKLRAQKSSRFRGVCRHPKAATPWQSHIKLSTKVISLGRYRTEREAALAFDVAARLTRGPGASLNFPATERCGLEILARVFGKVAKEL
jgi:hypothetical protein